MRGHYSTESRMDLADNRNRFQGDRGEVIQVSRGASGIGGLNCFYTNARSLRNKKDELFSYISNEDIDILCVTESWVNEIEFSDTISEFDLQGYNMYISQRTGRIGGGIIIYIKNNIVSSLNTSIKQDGVESLWIDIRFSKNRMVHLGAFYRPPGQTDDIDELMIREISKGCETDAVIIGDFNLNSVDWENMIGRDRTSGRFIECFEDNFLNQFVNDSTRGDNILDLVLSNSDHLVQELTVGEALGNSDHQIVRFNLGIEKGKITENAVKVPNFHKGDYVKLRSLLNFVDWDVEFRGKNAYGMWDTFKHIINVVQEQCIPMKAIRNKSRKPLWWNQEIARKISEKKRAYKKLQVENNIQNLSDYRMARNELNKIIKKNKRVSEIKLAQDSNKDPRKFFSYYKINNKSGRVKIGPIKYEGFVRETDEEIVEVLNGHFASVFTKEKLNSPMYSTHRSGKEVFTNICVDRRMIKGLIGELDTTKASGPDNIHSRILKEGVESISIALDKLYTRSLEYGEIPDDWKRANVVPIFKKGSKEDPNNFRPVSLTPVVCKILEKIVKKGICQHLEREGLISDAQHGFRSGRSCLTNLLDFLEFVTDQVDKGENVDIIYLDFSKAFDKVPHRRLVHKLKMIGICGGVSNWIAEWLKDRKQRVVLNGVKSEWRDVISGVPQGSVLGPLLFVIYINDLGEAVNNKVSIFADDTKLAAVVKDIDDNFKVQGDLNKLLSWAHKWQMTFNLDKCKVINMGKDNREFNYEMDGHWLSSVEDEKDLGVVIDKSLRFSKQCIEARNRANRVLGFIKRNVSYKSKEVILKLYNSYVRPHLEYCIQAWSPHFRHDINLLESVQRRATKIIPSLRHLEYIDRLRVLNMFSFERRCVRGDMIELFKIFSGIDKLDVSKFFELDDGNRTRGHHLKIKKQGCRLDLRKYFFTNRVVDFWNKLPRRVVGSPNLNVFKSRLDEFMGREGCDGS